MKNFLFISLLLLVLIGSNACSSGTTGNPSQANNRNSATNANLPDNTVAVNPDTNVYPLKEAFNGVNVEGPGKNPGKAAATPAGRILPDGSEMFVELRDVPIETRVFKGNSQLLKVVKSGLPSQSKVKIYLKSGKIVEIPGDKVPNLATAQAADLLNAAGVKPEAPPPADTRSGSKKTDQKQ